MTFATDSTTGARSAPCKKKCGFFANAQLDGFCSQCYSEERKQFKPVETEDISNSTEALSSSVENLSTEVQSKRTTTTSKERPTRKTRCPNCHKATGILQYPCVCGGCFCSNCRYSTEHQCPVDYKAMGRTSLAKNNPPVIADRVPNRQ